MAAQYYTISLLLLASFNPEVPRIGPERLVALRDSEREIKEGVKSLCGIAMSNPGTVPALLTACQGISLCGDHFSDPEEQQALLDVLAKANEETAWPTYSMRERLEACWARG